MSFLSKIWWWSGSIIAPNKDFNTILGEGKEYHYKNKELIYGSPFEIMTSPGRQALRNQILNLIMNKNKLASKGGKIHKSIVLI